MNGKHPTNSKREECREDQREVRKKREQPWRSAIRCMYFAIDSMDPTSSSHFRASQHRDAFEILLIAVKLGINLRSDYTSVGINVLTIIYFRLKLD